jgi:hypothetical protein
MTTYIRRGALALAIGAFSLSFALGKLPGKGAGLFEAAANSPSLTVCDGGGGEVIVTSADEPDAGVDVGDGVISVS